MIYRALEVIQIFRAGERTNEGVPRGPRGHKKLYFLLAGLVDPLAASLASECEKSRLKTYSYGAALIAGGTKDTVADYIGNNRFDH